MSRSRYHLLRSVPDSSLTFEARAAAIVDPITLNRLGILIGTADGGKLVMRRGDWRRALTAKAVRLIDEPDSSHATTSALPGPTP